MYEVRFYKGDYLQRQLAANADKAVAYVDTTSTAVLRRRRAMRSWWWARTRRAPAATGDAGMPRRWPSNSATKAGGDQGIMVGGWEGRGDGNVKHTKMPAVLLEPLFASHPQQAEAIRGDAGQAVLAPHPRREHPPLLPRRWIGRFSVGHKYKVSSPNDRGAALAGGGNEADHAEKVLLKAEEMLHGVTGPEEERHLRVVKGEATLLDEVIDEDAQMVWDPERCLLRIVG